jgi:hypothetical protein
VHGIIDCLLTFRIKGCSLLSHLFTLMRCFTMQCCAPINQSIHSSPLIWLALAAAWWHEAGIDLRLHAHVDMIFRQGRRVPVAWAHHGLLHAVTQHAGVGLSLQKHPHQD